MTVLALTWRRRTPYTACSQAFKAWRRFLAPAHLLIILGSFGLGFSPVAAQEDSGTVPPALELSAAEKAWIKRHPVVRLGADPDYPPFEFFDNRGLYKGIASDYIRIIERHTGLKILTPVNQPWPETMRQARAYRVDLLAAVAKSPEREGFLSFSEPYQEYRRVILMRDDAQPISGAVDLVGQRIGALRESTDPAFLRQNAPGTEIVLFDTYDSALLALSEGDVQAVVGNGLSAIYIARQLGVLDVKIAAPASLNHYSLYFAARKDWPELISIINKVLATIPIRERNEIQSKWALASAPAVIDYSLIWKTLLAITPLLLIAFGWIFHAKRQQLRLVAVQQQLRDATARAEAANKAKSTFLANMSHEMRTPLTSIIGFLGLILDANPRKEVRQHAEISLGSARGLLQLINDILDLARLESGATSANRVPMSVPDLIKSVLAAMRPLADEKNLYLKFETRGLGPNLVLQDDKMLRQILVNLIGNAIKFTKAGGVSVQLDFLPSDRPAQCCYQIDVCDTGIGIETDQQARLTQRFEQVHSLAVNNSSGTGLGLAICKELAHLLGGSFFFTSEIGKGSVFSVKLYSRLAEAHDNIGDGETGQAGLVEDEQTACLNGTVIYMADDNAIIRQLVEKMLAPHQVAMSMFEDGQHLFETLQEQALEEGRPACDMVLMDIHMPKMDGLEAQQCIRRLGPDFNHLPIIALTANAIKGEREMYLSEGMDDYISKPIDPDRLIAAVRRFRRIKTGSA